MRLMSTAIRRPAGRASRDERADDTKRRLLAAAMDVFGRNGFEASSTRMLAAAGGVNLQSIAYYFGSKEGLYLAVAEYVAERVGERVGPLAQMIGEQLAAAPRGRLEADQARGLLQKVLTTMAHLLLHDDSAPWARYMIREQMEPTAAFDHVYERVLSPTLALVRTLIGAAIGKDPNSELVRLRSIATMGQVLVLRAGRATLLRQLAWTEVGHDELAAIDALVIELVQAIVPAPTRTNKRVAGASSPARKAKRSS
jgi:TetR/AcrR family transcriptional regulator, regulator of cefoperazone and chloramphenicol sensitivity